MFDINWFAVLVCALVNMVTGAIWYGPLFGKRWMTENGFTMEKIEADPSNVPYIFAGVNSLIMAIVLAIVIGWAGATGAIEGALTGALMWLGFTAFTFGANHAFEFRSIPLWLINAGPYFVGLLLMGVILGVWQ